MIKRVLCFCGVAALAPFLALSAAAQVAPFCQILDRDIPPAWEINGLYMVESDVDLPGAPDFSTTQIEGGGGLAYADVHVGSMDLTGSYDLRMFSSSAGLNLPDYVGELSLHGAYTWRSSEGQAVRVQVSPGLHSDLEEISADAIYFPFEVKLIQAFSPEVSGMMGLAFFPGFEQSVDPRFGIRWQIDDLLTLDLMYPESRLVLEPIEQWKIYAGVKVDLTPEWKLEEDDERESIAYNETRAFLGLQHPIADVLMVRYEGGVAFGRTFDFERLQGESDVDDAFYLRIGVSSPL